MCQKEITQENAIQLVSEGKTALIEGFTSKKGRPFDAFIKRNDARIAWEFPPRKHRIGKDGKPIVRKTKAPPDLSKAKSLGESTLHHGEIVELDGTYYVRKPDQENRSVFKITKELCKKELPLEEVQKLLTEGKTSLIEGFVSKRGSEFSAYLVLGPKKDKADFEFPPR